MAHLAAWAVAVAAGLLPPAFAASPALYAASAAAQARPLAPAQRLERRFLQIATANLRFQAEASRLADARSNNPAVKEVAGAVLARDRAAQPDLLRLLHARGMAPPIPVPAHTRVMKRLAKLNGAKFDRLYIDDVVLATFRADLLNYEKLALEAEDPVLKQWVQGQLPTLRVDYGKAQRALPGGLRRQGL